MRKNPDEQMSLEELGAAYIANKSELDSYKKICEAENNELKDRMVDAGLVELPVGEKKIKRIVTTSFKVNEALMLKTVKELGLTGCIRTQEYIDAEALESILYNLPAETAATVATALDKCKVAQEVVQLRILKNK